MLWRDWLFQTQRCPPLEWRRNSLKTIPQKCDRWVFGQARCNNVQNFIGIFEKGKHNQLNVRRRRESCWKTACSPKKQESLFTGMGLRPWYPQPLLFHQNNCHHCATSALTPSHTSTSHTVDWDGGQGVVLDDFPPWRFSELVLLVHLGRRGGFHELGMYIMTMLRRSSGVSLRRQPASQMVACMYSLINGDLVFPQMLEFRDVQA